VVCGNGVVELGEVCDDKNNTDCDGCRADCSAVETGCGDGFVCSSERLRVTFEDTVGDGGPVGDVASVTLEFDKGSGDYTVTWVASSADPFHAGSGGLRLNLNVGNKDRLTVAFLFAIFTDVAPTLTLSYSGNVSSLKIWMAGDTVVTFGSNPPFPTPAFESGAVEVNAPYGRDNILVEGELQGNGVGAEACDDGNNTDCDGCRADCSAVETGCGDGFVCGAEACDDGDNTDCDGCRADCSATENGCGDGFVCGAEACDEGSESAACDDDCTAVECGDAHVNKTAGERCDDAGESTACDSDCTWAVCGDGTLNVTAGEQCDDGNTDSGDGCDANCRLYSGSIINFGPNFGPPPGETELTDQLRGYGVVFSSTSPEGVRWHGGDPPRSSYSYCINAGWNGGYGSTDPIRVDFDPSVVEAAIRAFDDGGDLDTLILSAFDSLGALVDSDEITSGFRYPGQVAAVSASEIAYITFEVQETESGLFFDDLTFKANGHAFDFEYRCVVVSELSTNDVATGLLDDLSQAGLGQGFYVEFWATDSAAENTGVVSAYTDMDYPNGLVKCGDEIGNTPLFSVFPGDNVCDGSIVDELGGSQLTCDVGVEPEWVRVAYAEFTCNAMGTAEFVLHPAAAESSACNRGLVENIDYGTCSVECLGCWCIYDLDNNCTAAGGDLGLFAGCWLCCDTEPRWEENACESKDFDCNGCVAGGDLGWFAGAWLKRCDELDPVANYPDCRDCEAPIVCPWPGDSRSATTSVGAAPSDVPESDGAGAVKLTLRLVRKLAGSAESAALEPSVVSELERGERVYAEIWATDEAPSSGGITAVFADLFFDPTQLRVLAVDPGDVFTLFAANESTTEYGTVRGVGGATLEPSIGVGSWVRVSAVELQALGNVRAPRVSIRPIVGEAVSRRGLGLVPQDQVEIVERNHKLHGRLYPR